jgi:uncharacterized membrane protein YeaQ/YmgE (transglycosylase-associated protein family)
VPEAIRTAVLLFILIALIAGALAGRVASGHGYGVLGDIVVGAIVLLWLIRVILPSRA